MDENNNPTMNWRIYSYLRSSQALTNGCPKALIGYRTEYQSRFTNS